MKNLDSLLLSAVHFNSVEKGIINLFHSKDFELPLSLERIFPKWFNRQEHGYSIMSVEKEISIFFDLVREFSVLCVNLQFPNGNYDHMVNKIKKEKIHLLSNKKDFKELTLIELLKALDSTVYQLEFEHILLARPLSTQEKNIILALYEFSKLIRRMIVEGLSEYKTASWIIK